MGGKTPEEMNAETRKGLKRDLEQDVPCFKEMNLSLKCLDRNSTDKDKCQKYFDNYKICTEFWSRVQWDRKRRGIEPILPKVEDRERVKDEYRKKWHMI